MAHIDLHSKIKWNVQSLIQRNTCIGMGDKTYTFMNIIISDTQCYSHKADKLLLFCLCRGILYFHIVKKNPNIDYHNLEKNEID